MYIEDVDEHDVAKQFVGKSIVSVDEASRTFELDDGTVLTFEDTSDCSKFFDVEKIKLIDTSDNRIVKVERLDLPDGDDYLERFSFVLLTKATTYAQIDIMCTSRKGYYVHSVDLVVSKKKECK